MKNKQATIVSSILKQLAREVKPGVMTATLDGICEELIKAAGATSANKNYKPNWAPSAFPATLCTSVNDCICHGIPTEYKLKEGDIINLDLGIEFEGLCGDAALTVPVGYVEPKHSRLMLYALRTLYAGIEMIGPGVNVIEIGRAIQTYAWRMGYKTNKAFSGHHIGKTMHEPPFIPHCHELDPEWIKSFDATLKEGDIVCLEPMLTFRDEIGYPHKNGWSRLTRDGKYSAMFEHMILVTKDGHEVLTDHFDQHFFDN